MKKQLVLVVVAALLILLASCGHSEDKKDAGAKQVTGSGLIHKDDLFEMKLNIAKTTFKKDEAINLSASLTYIGDKHSITVWGGHTNVLFTINSADNQKFEMGGASTLELTTTMYKHGKTVEFPFFKSGGYDEKDPDASFWKKFYAEKELRLPPGKYVISAVCDFSLDEEVVHSHYPGEVHTTITVE